MQMHLVIQPAAQRRNVTYHNIKSKVDLESNYIIAVSRVPVNLCTNLCYHMQAEGGVRAT